MNPSAKAGPAAAPVAPDESPTPPPPPDRPDQPPPAPPAGAAVDDRPFGELPLAVAGARVMLEQLDRIAAHEAGARTGADPEDVHRMRVATRRLRAALRVFRGALTPAAGGPPLDLERTTVELRALAAALGTVRDLDVFALAIRKHARAAPPADRPALRALAADLKRESHAAQDGLRAFLDGPALAYLRDEVRPALAAVAASGRGRKRDAVRRRAPRLIVRALRRLYKNQATLFAPASSELHELRILAKRARYAGEFFAPAFGERLVEPIAQLTAVQDVLGEIHDADVAIGVLLARIETVAGDAARAPEAAPLARLVGRVLAARDADLATFRAGWAVLPRPRALKRTLARPADGAAGAAAPHRD
jgi:CHAD domain-containing protein